MAAAGLQHESLRQAGEDATGWESDEYSEEEVEFPEGLGRVSRGRHPGNRPAAVTLPHSRAVALLCRIWGGDEQGCPTRPGSRCHRWSRARAAAPRLDTAPRNAHRQAGGPPWEQRCPGIWSSESSSVPHQADWRAHHCLLCTGGGDGAAAGSSSGAGGSGAGAGGPPAPSYSAPRAIARDAAALAEFKRHAYCTNDIFQLAAMVLCNCLLRACDAAGDSTDVAACERALLEAWRPYHMGHKQPWWDCSSGGDEAVRQEIFRAAGPQGP